MVKLRDVGILNSIVLHVKTRGFKFKEGNSPISIITKFTYESMTIGVVLGCTSPKGETIIFQSD